MRGIHKMRSLLASIPRITPVYAGNTRNGQTVLFIRWDHPRLCGEYLDLSIARTPALGSPPSMRGIHIDAPDISPEVGITPVYAGNTKLSLSS